MESREDVFKGRLSGNPFHQIDFPTQRVREAALEVVEALNSVGLDRCTALALTLASSYASPVLATKSVVRSWWRVGLRYTLLKGLS